MDSFPGERIPREFGGAESATGKGQQMNETMVWPLGRTRAKSTKIWKSGEPNPLPLLEFLFDASVMNLRSFFGRRWLKAEGDIVPVKGVRSSESRFCRGILRFRSSAKALGGRKESKHPRLNIQHSAVVKALWRDEPLNDRIGFMIFGIVANFAGPAMGPG